VGYERDVAEDPAQNRRMPELVEPTTRVRQSFIEAMDEFRAEGRGVPGDTTAAGVLIREHAREWATPDGFEQFVTWLIAQGLEETPRAEGFVPATELW
jgi:hypothetical protein